jgi:hypothetical protein
VRILVAALLSWVRCAPAAPPPCAHGPREVAPGVTLERIAPSIAPALPIGDRCLTLVRIDPARHRPRLLTARRDGGQRAAPGWAADFDLIAVINASMFHDDLRSTGLMVDRGHVNNGRDNPRFGGYLAFDPVDPADPPLHAAGRDCPGFDLADLRARYRVVVQNYRLLDCAGGAIAWQDPKIYSSAAIGVDRDGRAVLLHVRAPYRMRDLSAMLAAPALRLRAMHYVEGGPEASLWVRGAVEAVGSFETGFVEDDGNRRFWDIPNVIGFE